MTFSDIIIIGLLIVLVGIVVYTSFIKNRGNPCKGCAYSKSCNKNLCNKKGN